MKYAKARGNGNCAEIGLIGHFMQIFSIFKMLVRIKISISRIVWHQNLIVISPSKIEYNLFECNNCCIFSDICNQTPILFFETPGTVTYKIQPLIKLTVTSEAPQFLSLGIS